MSVSISPGNEESYSDAYFLFDDKNKKILLATVPVQEFFEPISLDSNHDFISLLNAAAADPAHTKREWETSLRLKENQTHHFSFTMANSNTDSRIYTINVRQIRLADISVSPLLFIHGKKVFTTVGDSSVGNSLPNYAKDYAEFIDLAAHDLDAPLRKLSVLVDRVVEKLGPSAALQGHINRIQGCVSDMRKMIDTLSTYAGIDADVSAPELCDLFALINEITAELKQAIEEKKMNVVIHALPKINGNKQQLKQLLRALLENALRFSKKEERPVAEFRSERVSEEEKSQYKLIPEAQYVKIILRDNGIGFAKEDAEKIFRPFVRLNGKSEYPGSGMGLAICRKIAEKHNGIIYAEAERTNGASFTLILPQT